MLIEHSLCDLTSSGILTCISFAVWRIGTHLCISQTMDDDEVESAADDEARAAVRRQPRQ